MVDAIGAQTNKPVKLTQDRSINWQQCTIDEIKEYQGQGQSVPTDILRWAEEIAKIASLPDDVTYELTNGSTDITEINQLLAATDETDVNAKDETNPKTGMTQAQQERSVLEEGGTSLADQGKIFIGKSAEASSATGNAMNTLQGALDLSNSIVEQADAQAAATEAETKAVKQEYDKLLEKAKTKNAEEIGLTAAEQAKMAQLGQQLNNAGTKAQAALAGFDTQIANVSGTIEQGKAVPPAATDYGTQTTDIGLELMGKTDEERSSIMDGATSAAGTNHKEGFFRREVGGALGEIKQNAKPRLSAFLFNADYMLGVRASRLGARTMDTGAQGEARATQVETENEANKNKINEDKTKVKNATYVAAEKSPDEAGDKEGDKTDSTDEATKAAAANQEDITLADETITTDPNEIQKRKERKGLA